MKRYLLLFILLCYSLNGQIITSSRKTVLNCESQIAFGTITTSWLYYTTLSNNSSQTITITSYTGLANPFSLGNTVVTLAAGASFQLPIYCYTYSASNGSYIDTLFIYHSANNNPAKIILTATINLPNQELVFTLQPQNQTVNVGEDAVFTADFSGAVNKGFQWWYTQNGVVNACTDGAMFSGSTTGTLTVLNSQLSYNGISLSCEAKNLDCYPNSGCWLNSNTVTLTIENPEEVEPIYSIAATYFVDDANGNDNNNGTSEVSAWKTISKAVSIAQPGDIVEFLGDYVITNQSFSLVRSGTSTNAIVFRTQLDHQTTIQYNTGTLIIPNGYNYIHFYGFNFVGKYYANLDSRIGYRFINCNFSHYADASDYVGVFGIRMQNASYFVIRKCEFTGSLTGSEGEDILGMYQRNHHNVIEENIFIDGGHTAIALHGYDYTKINAPIENSSRFNVIKNNYFHSRFKHSFNLLVSPYFTLVEGNVVAKSGTGTNKGEGIRSPIAADGNEIGASYIQGRNNIVRNNIITKSGAAVVNPMAFSINGGSGSGTYGNYCTYNNRVYNNTMYKNYDVAFGGGLVVYSADNPTDMPFYGSNRFKNNIFYQTGKATFPEQYSNITFDNSTGMTLGTGWSVSGGYAISNGSSGTLGFPNYIGRYSKYRVTFTISNRTAGSVKMQTNYASYTDRSANGTYVEEVRTGYANPFTYLNFVSTGFNGSIDNVLIEVIPFWQGIPINYIDNNEISGATRGTWDDEWNNNLLNGTDQTDVLFYGYSTTLKYNLATLEASGFQGADVTFDNNIQANPLFANQEGTFNQNDITESRNLFALQNGSPCVDAGTHLTTTDGGGTNSTQVKVIDPYYFAGGTNSVNWDGIIEGDLIRVGSSNVQITSIDYGTRILTVTPATTWTNGTSVSLQYNGTKPDIGAIEKW